MKRLKPLQIIVVVVSSILVHSLCLAGLIAFAGSSMEPTIKDGQKAMVNSYPKDKSPERGDIIVFKMDKLTYVRRVIGIPLETVIIRDGVVFIATESNPQGEKLDEPYLAPETVTGPDGEFQVPDGQYFVLGDNREHSRDSRQIGYIPRETITGKVTKVY